MAAKDAALILQAGRDGGVDLPMAAAIAERMARTVEAGHGDKDMAATYLVARNDG